MCVLQDAKIKYNKIVQHINSVNWSQGYPFQKKKNQFNSQNLGFWYPPKNI